MATSVKPVFTKIHDTSGASAALVTTSFTVMHSGIVGPIREIEIFNNTSQTIDVGFGHSDSVVLQPFKIFPNGNPSVPVVMANNTRIALRGSITSATAGLIIMNFYL